MSGRRSHPRLMMARPWDGALEVLRDVVIDRIGRDELLAISSAPAVEGQEMSLDLISEDVCVATRVRVLACRPVMVNGSVKHQMRLGVVGVPQISPASDAAEV